MPLFVDFDAMRLTQRSIVFVVLFMVLVVVLVIMGLGWSWQQR